MLNLKIVAWLATAALLGGCTQPPAPAAPAVPATTKEEAAAAWQRQDYVTAERLYRSLAEKGDASAQHFLGKMYENGEGVRRNSAEAARWFRLAAEQGHTGAQFYLGGDVRQRQRRAARLCAGLHVARSQLDGRGRLLRGGKPFRSRGEDDTRSNPAEAQRLVDAWKANRSK